MNRRTSNQTRFSRDAGSAWFETLERREVMDASLQVIHNSPYAAAAVVDVYVNDSLLVDNFAFRSATPFVTVPSGVNLKVDITAGDAPNNASPVFTATVNLTANTTYLAIAEGNPVVNVGPTAFGLAVSDLGRQSAAAPANAEFLVFHGTPDAPAVDVIARGVGTLVNDLTFPNFAPSYLSVPPASYTIDVTLADGKTRVRSFNADLSGAAGAALVVAASGFVAPGPSDPGFGLLAVFADGTTALLPEVQPVVQGTNGSDTFTVGLKSGIPGVVEVRRGGESAQFLALTNPLLSIEGGRGSDTLKVNYSTAGALPALFFDGGAGYDTIEVKGSASDDTIKLIEASTAANLPAGVLALKGVEYAAVWAGKGHDTVDASGLRTVNTLLDGQEGNDKLKGGRARDVIYGGAGNDWLEGGDGNDSLFGGAGDDMHDGGSGFDLVFDIFGRNRIKGKRGWISLG